jgi:hypothetical protein
MKRKSYEEVSAELFKLGSWACDTHPTNEQYERNRLEMFADCGWTSEEFDAALEGEMLGCAFRAKELALEKKKE